MATQPLDHKFWTRFTKTYWERNPVIFKGIQSNLLQLDETEVFKLLVAAADLSRKNRSPLGFKFFVNGIRSSDIETMFVLPKKSDRSLKGYHQRMERVYQDYCLVCDELLQVNQDKQNLLNQFTQTLYSHVGLPNRFAEMGLYLGNYRKTPFGVHVDGCGVFSFPVIGTKKFRTWKAEYVRKNPKLEQSFHYSKYKKDSLLLSVEPGDMAYWPSSAWHIAESNGKFSATWSLGVWVDQPTQTVVTEIFMNLLAAKIGDTLVEPTIKARKFNKENGQIDDLPEVLVQTTKALKDVSQKELTNSFRKFWMNRVSSHGMKTLPKSSSNFRLGRAVVLRDLHSPILWTKITGRKFTVAYSFAGAELKLSGSKELLKVIQRLNLGETCSVKPAVKSDLQKLAKLGAIVNK